MGIDRVINLHSNKEYNRMTEKEFKEVHEWQKKTFGEATALSKLYHLKEEVTELIDALKVYEEDKSVENFKKINHEYADCELLLNGSAAVVMTYKTLTEGRADKMRINRSRKWGKPDNKGVVHHIKV